MFATKAGTVRRNKLSDFVQVNRNGKIAMKFDSTDEAIVDVQLCNETDDVLLTTAAGQCIRFPAGDVRVFKGRDSTGVRGISLGKDDSVISMAILNHFDANSDERNAYLKMSRAVRGEGEAEAAAADDEEAGANGGELSQERYAAMGAAEQFILTASENGYGKRTSSHEYRITGRGGKGIVAMAVNERNGPLVASFPVDDSDELMLVTDGGQVIRMPVRDIRIIGRGTQGVTLFDVGEDEKVVSVERLSESEDEEAADGEAGEAEAPA